MIEDTLFITGAQRSGTTLLEKLIGAIPGLSVLSQPFPLLFVAVKGEFLRSIGLGDVAYPLGHLFREDRYDPSSFAAFLERWRTCPEALRGLFEEMRDYSGQYTKLEPEQLERAFANVTADDDFAAVVRALDHSLGAAGTARFFGSKETTCEEFLLPLLDRGVRCILILRDPRDVLASLNHGRGTAFAGSPKPTLFNIRSWRKSVAHAFALEGHPRFQWCRYEDLVRDAGGVVRRIAEALDLPEPLRVDVRDWRGNSSHSELEGISESPIGNYKNVLRPDVQLLMEAACLPELKALDYRTSLSVADAAEILRGIREPYVITREGMDADRADGRNAKLEVERLARASDPPSAESSSWFLFERAHARLSRALRS